MKLAADRGVCVGAGMCVMSAPDLFDQDDDGIVTVLVEDVTANDVTKARQAVSLCPSGALTMLDEGAAIGDR